MVRIQKPTKIDIVKDRGYGSEQSKKAAEAIKQYWEDADRNLSEIARRSDIPQSTISKVYNQHMGPKGGSKTIEQLREEQKEEWEPTTQDPDQDQNLRDGVVSVQEALRMSQESYRKGYQDCREDIFEIIELFGVESTEDLEERLSSP